MGALPSIQQLLEHIKEAHALRSDYALAKFLDVSQSSVKNWRQGSTAPDDVLCLVIAERLNLDEAYLLALVHANRQRYSPAARVWLQIYELAKMNAAGHGRRVL